MPGPSAPYASNSTLARCVCLDVCIPAGSGRAARLHNEKACWPISAAGPFGREGWANLDLYPAEGLTLRTDCRRDLPLGDGSCRGIHVEHYLEHLEPTRERGLFLAECRRCLEEGGVLRIVVPDMRKYIEAYLAPGWDLLNTIGCGGERPQSTFGTKIEALNHVFVQDGEHYGGYDEAYLRTVLEAAGFRDVRQVAWREGAFPGGAIDRDQHRPYSLYMEARR